MFTNLGVFSPLKDEPVWWEDFLDDLNWQGVHMGESFQLGFYSVSKTEYQKTRGVLTLPDINQRQSGVPEVILVPGLGFTSRGERLGRGKGYYDRYLKNFSGITIGVFFSESKCSDVFAESHDMTLDFIVTDKEVLQIKK